MKKLIEARGFTQSEFCKNSGIAINTLRSHIEYGRMTGDYLVIYSECLGCDISDLLQEDLDETAFVVSTDISCRWPYNLANTILGSTGVTNMLYHVYVPGLFKAMEEELLDREKAVLILRYKHLQTLEKSGKSLGVTRERIRQIEAKAIRKLRHPRSARTWLLDTDLRWYEAENEVSRLKLQNVVMKDKIDRLISEKEGNQDGFVLNSASDSDGIPIEDLDLSVRSYNCLRKAGIYYVNTLKDITVKDMKRIRGLGQKSMAEIISRSRVYGVIIREE